MRPSPLLLWSLSVAAVLLVIVVPLVRLYRTTGVFGLVVHRDADPAQRRVGLGLLLLLVGLLVWPGLLQLLGPEALLVGSPPRWLTITALVGAVVGIGIVVLAQAQMGASWRIGLDDRPTELVEHGLYRWVRHPIYTGLLLALAGLVLATPSPWSAGAWLLTVAVTSFQARREERHLVGKTSDAYLDYARRTGRFLPGVGRLQVPASGGD